MSDESFEALQSATSGISRGWYSQPLSSISISHNKEFKRHGRICMRVLGYCNMRLVKEGDLGNASFVI